VNTACAHCGQPVARAAGAEDASFCCNGCEAVWHALHEAGLEAYYRVRQDLPPPADVDVGSPEIDPRWIEDGGDGPRIHFAVEGIHCASCAWVIEEVLRKEPAVRRARVALARERLTVDLRDTGDPAAVVRALERVGYRARPAAEVVDPKGGRRIEVLRFGVAAACAMNLMLFAVSLYGGERWGIEPGLEQLFRWLSFGVATPLVLFSAWPIVRRALGAVRHRTIHVDVPVALAIGVMYGSSAWNTVRGDGAIWFDSLGMLVALLLGGRLLEGAVRRHAGQRLQALVGRRDETARRITTAGVVQVAPEALRPGDRLELLPGDVSVVDLALTAGTSDVDLSVVDGESQPRTVAGGRDLPAGAKVLTGRLEGTVLKAAAAGSLAGLRRQVDDALARRSTVELLADRVARGFVAAVLLVAAATAAAWSWVDPSQALPITVAVLVVACPCALALATPLAFASAVHAAAARGIVVRQGSTLLALGRIDRLVFDKTGTITHGRLDPGPFSGTADDLEVLRLAAAACRGSLHPVARGVVQASREAGATEVPLAIDLREVAGVGLTACVEGRTVSVGRPGATVHIDGRLAGRVPLEDRVRDDAAAALSALRDRGVAVAMLSGDEPSVVEALAGTLDIDLFEGGLLPSEKAAALRGFRAAGEQVAFVGDGLNDAPALAEATVGLAMGSAVDLSVEAADGALLGGGLMSLSAGIGLGRRLRRTLVQNVSLSITYNVLAVTAAASGLLSPLEAAALMPLSSLLVVVNAARLTRAP
jgi:P-type Cu2+ transporter